MEHPALERIRRLPRRPWRVGGPVGPLPREVVLPVPLCAVVEALAKGREWRRAGVTVPRRTVGQGGGAEDVALGAAPAVAEGSGRPAGWLDRGRLEGCLDGLVGPAGDAVASVV